MNQGLPSMNQGLSSMNQLPSMNQGLNQGLPSSSMNQNQGLSSMNQGLNQGMNQGLPSMNQGLQSMNQGLQSIGQGLPPMGQGLSQAAYMGYPYSPYMYPQIMRPSAPYNGMPMTMGFPPSMGMHNNSQQKASRFHIRPGCKPGPWCMPGCLIGLYDDGLGHPTIYAHMLAVVSTSNTVTDTTLELTVTVNDEITLLNVDPSSLVSFKEGDKNEFLCLSPQGKVAIWDKVCPQSRIFGLALRNKTLFSESGDVLPDETEGVVGVRALIDNQIAASMVPNSQIPSNSQIPRISNSDETMSSQLSSQLYGMPTQQMYNNWR